MELRYCCFPAGNDLPAEVTGVGHGLLNGLVGIDPRGNSGKGPGDGAGKTSDCNAWHAVDGLRTAAQAQGGAGLTGPPPGPRNCYGVVERFNGGGRR